MLMAALVSRSKTTPQDVQLFKGSLHPQEDILEDLAMDVLIVFLQVCLELWKSPFLFIVPNRQLTGKLFAGRGIASVKKDSRTWG
jgi:hypothetical protein